MLATLKEAIPATPDLIAIKQRQQQTWAVGDYSVIGTTLQIVGERLCESVDIRAGEQVLDVAAGNGNATLAAARRFAEVTSTDYVGEWLARGQSRAAAEGLTVLFKEADAEALPFADQQFDAVLSTFGVMFTANQEQAASELSRVVRSGGRIGLANWTPDSYVGQVFKTMGRHVPPPAGLVPPALWGTEARLRELFPSHDMRLRKRSFTFRYRSAKHMLDTFRTFYGPVNRAFAALDAKGQAALEADVIAVMERFNSGGDRTMLVPAEYLEAVITRR